MKDQVRFFLTLNIKATCIACTWGLLVSLLITTFVSFIGSYIFHRVNNFILFHDYDTTNVHSCDCEFESRSLPTSKFLMI